MNADESSLPAAPKQLPFGITQSDFDAAHFAAAYAVGHSGSHTFCRRFLEEVAKRSAVGVFPLAVPPLHVVETGKSVNSEMEADIAKHLAENFVCGHYGTWKFDATARCIGLIVERAREDGRDRRLHKRNAAPADAPSGKAGRTGNG